MSLSRVTLEIVVQTIGFVTNLTDMLCFLSMDIPHMLGHRSLRREFCVTSVTLEFLFFHVDTFFMHQQIVLKGTSEVTAINVTSYVLLFQMN